MKKLLNLFVLLLAAIFMFTGCVDGDFFGKEPQGPNSGQVTPSDPDNPNDNPNNNPGDNQDGPTDNPMDNPDIPTNLPYVAGVAGKYTIVFKIPETLHCEPIINFFGDFQYNDLSYSYAPEAEKINQTGFENWYKVVFGTTDPSLAAGKICPQVDGEKTWNAQGMYELIQGDADIVNDFGNSNKIVCSESALGNVVYVEVTKWAMDPCARPNEAGKACFSVLVKTEFPKDFDPYGISIGVSYGPEWKLGEDLLKFSHEDEDGYYFYGCIDNYPANAMYKYTILDNYAYNNYGVYDWIYESGQNRTMPYGNSTDDVVTEWDSEPWWDYVTGGGEVTLYVELCDEYVDYPIYIVGNFGEQGSGNYWVECLDNDYYKMQYLYDNVYTWTGVVPNFFRFQVVAIDSYYDDMHWLNGERDFAYDGSNWYTVGCY